MAAHHKRQLKPDEERRIVQRLKAGISQKLIARIFQRCPGLISAIAKKHQIPPAGRGWSAV